MLDLVQNIEFRDTSHHLSSFQQNLKSGIKRIRDDNLVYIKGDKTTNYHKMTKENYERFKDQNIQKAYKKCPTAEVNKLIKDEKKIATDLGIGDRMDKPPEIESYLHLKDHKPNLGTTHPLD